MRREQRARYIQHEVWPSCCHTCSVGACGHLRTPYTPTGIHPVNPLEIPLCPLVYPFALMKCSLECPCTPLYARHDCFRSKEIAELQGQEVQASLTPPAPRHCTASWALSTTWDLGCHPPLPSPRSACPPPRLPSAHPAAVPAYHVMGNMHVRRAESSGAASCRPSYPLFTTFIIKHLIFLYMFFCMFFCMFFISVFIL